MARRGQARCSTRSPLETMPSGANAFSRVLRGHTFPLTAANLGSYALTTLGPKTASVQGFCPLGQANQT
jgi:hypothetical protein